MSHDALEAAADLALVERLRQQLVALDELAQQALRARDAERAARRNAEADADWWHATVANYVTAATYADRERLRGVLAEGLTQLHPGASLVTDLARARAVVTAAEAWREAVETMDGQWSAEQALLAALRTIDEGR